MMALGKTNNKVGSFKMLDLFQTVPSPEYRLILKLHTVCLVLPYKTITLCRGKISTFIPYILVSIIFPHRLGFR